MRPLELLEDADFDQIVKFTYILYNILSLLQVDYRVDQHKLLKKEVVYKITISKINDEKDGWRGAELLELAKDVWARLINAEARRESQETA